MMEGQENSSNIEEIDEDDELEDEDDQKVSIYLKKSWSETKKNIQFIKIISFD